MDLEQRRAELAANLAKVRARLTAACDAAGRERGEVTLVAVTKTFPASDAITLTGLGVPDIGENRDQEAAPKAAELAKAGVDVRWHFVGRLQRNKCRSVVGYADLVHSVDRLTIVDALARAAAGRPEPLEVLIQVSLDGDPRRGGMPIPGVADLADQVADRELLRLRGVMAVIPLGSDPDVEYQRLWRVAVELRQAHPGATVVSAGMSGDLEAAIRHGATHVRVGTALLGSRPPLR
ncbi:MAG TPA: YggS family pyridoxal phosphate-dependent enzyme [Micromonosporaceae bacterium]